ncbi:MAG: HAMP domain-containing sensor histidine kinase, partial [Myxococcota bacterium]
AALLAVASEPDRGAPLSESEVHTLEGHAELLEGFKEAVPVAEVRASTLRSVACDIQDILAAIPSGRLPRQKLRNLTRAAREVERIAAVSSVLQTRSAILQMDYTIRSFREFVTTDVRRAEQTTELQVSALLEEAHRQLTEYATSSEVDIRPRYQVGDARVRGIERELVRAFANLLHNAIKYSWRRDPHHRPWVGVSVHRDGSSICVVFENWGVPISEREIRDNLVFELGYRGKWSTDRGRLGTGIGLTDARDIALRHNGSITITSRPARSWGPDNRDHEEYYRQPFITTVTIALPEWV